MSGKIRQRGTLAIIIYFLMITAIWAPIGYYAGRARGETESRATTGTGKDLSRFETDRLEPSTTDGGGHHYAPIVFLPDQTEPMRIAAAQSRALDGPRRNASLRQNPLREAVLRSLANDAAAGATDSNSTESSSPQPFSLAMAPDSSGLGGGGQLSTFGGGSGLGGSTSGGPIPGGNGYPGAIIPGFLAPAAPPPDEEPPVLATPIPAALPMFLSGLAGCWAAARRKRAR